MLNKEKSRIFAGKLLKTALITTLLLSSIYGWYPDYTVLATDFKLRNDFLLPTQMNLLNLIGIIE